MNNKISIILCGCAILLTLIFRSEVYELTLPAGHFQKYYEKNISDQDGIAIHYHQRRPYYVCFQGEVHGVVADPIALVFEKAEISYQWVSTPAKRQLEILQKNETKTCAAGWFMTPERQKFAKFSLPVYRDRPFVALARADNELLPERTTVQNLLTQNYQKLLVKYGYSYGSYIDEKIEALNPRRIVTTAENKSMLQMIQAHRADFCFMTEEEANDLLLFSGIHKDNFKIISLSDVPEGNKRYIMCSLKISDEEMDKLNAAIAYFLNVPGDEK